MQLKGYAIQSFRIRKNSKAIWIKYNFDKKFKIENGDYFNKRTASINVIKCEIVTAMGRNFKYRPLGYFIEVISKLKLKENKIVIRKKLYIFINNKLYRHNHNIKGISQEILKAIEEYKKNNTVTNYL